MELQIVSGKIHISCHIRVTDKILAKIKKWGCPCRVRSNKTTSSRCFRARECICVLKPRITASRKMAHERPATEPGQCRDIVAGFALTRYVAARRACFISDGQFVLVNTTRYTLSVIRPRKRHATGTAHRSCTDPPVVVRRVVVACHTGAWPDVVFVFAGDTRDAPVSAQ